MWRRGPARSSGRLSTFLPGDGNPDVSCFVLFMDLVCVFCAVLVIRLAHCFMCLVDSYASCVLFTYLGCCLCTKMCLIFGIFVLPMCVVYCVPCVERFVRCFVYHVCFLCTSCVAYVFCVLLMQVECCVCISVCRFMCLVCCLCVLCVSYMCLVCCLLSFFSPHLTDGRYRASTASCSSNRRAGNP